MRSPPRLVIFDLDGTLFRTETVDIKAFNDALIKSGYSPKTSEEILNVIGLTLPEACAALLSTDDAEEIAKVAADIIFFEDQYIKAYGRLYEGATELIEHLKTDGYTLCICSNGNEEYVMGIADKFSLHDLFEEIWYSRDGITKSQAVGILKEKYRAVHFVMVGDRSSDIEAAQLNGGLSIGAAYGFGESEAQAADFVAHSIAEIAGLISRCFEKR